MLSVRELAAARAQYERALTDSAQIVRAAKSPDGLGGESSAESVAGACAVRIEPATSKALSGLGQEVLDQVRSRAAQLAYYPHGTDLRRGDVLVIGDGRRYRVLLEDNSARYAVSAFVVCVEA